MLCKDGERTGRLAEIWQQMKNSDEATAARQKMAYEKMQAEEAAKWREESKILLKCIYSGLSHEDIEQKSFEKFITTPDIQTVIDKLKNWSPELKFGIVLYGSTGTGKTHLLKALCIKWGSHYCRCLFRPAALILHAFRDGIDDLNYVNSIFQQPDILCIDDLGAEKITDWGNEKLLTLIDSRLRQEKITFISTNLELKEFPEKYGFRFANRLMENLVFQPLNTDSFRGQIYKANKEKWDNI